MAGESAALYLPADRALATRRGEELGTETGSVLLADLGGFTSLTKSLVATQGSRKGAEVLINHLNSLYDMIIDEIHRYGGVVVDFSGDAVNCFFGENGGHEPAERAVTAALGMQRRLAWRKDDGVDSSQFGEVSLKVAIATGSVHRLGVGNPDIRLFDVMSGSPAFEASRLEQLASAGQILVDTTTATRLEQSACGIHLSSAHREAFEVHNIDVMAGASRVAVDDLASIAANAWVDYRLRSDSGARSAELRSVVTLFVQFWQPDPNNPKGEQNIDGEYLQESVQTIQNVVDQHGGSLIQVTVGDKGAYCFCVFGAPVAHKELSDRALKCSLDLRLASAEWSVGIDQGVCRAGYYGSKTRRSYGVIGDCTNVAARLMTAGEPGQILVTSRVRSSWKRAVACGPEQLLHLAGQPEPVAVSKVEGYRIAGSEGRTFGDFTGRSEALVELRSHLSQVLLGTADVVVVAAEPGIGKSHMIEAARVELLDRSDVRWLQVSAEESNPRAMHPFIALIERVFYQELSEDPDVRLSLFETALDGLANEVRDDTPALGDKLMSLRDPLLALLGRGAVSSDSAVSRDSAVDAIVLVIEAMAVSRPLVLHIQDGEWMDLASKAVVAALVASRLEGVCVLLDTTAKHEVGADTTRRRVQLVPLDSEEVEAFAELHLHGRVGHSLIDYLFPLTTGNPLYVEHVLAALQQRRELYVDDDGRWQLAGDPAETLPESLTPILTARLDRLPVAVKGAVQLASVLGQTFEIGHLRAMGAAGGSEDLDDLVEQAVDQGIWSRDSGSCTFNSPLVRKAAHALYLDSDAHSHELSAAKLHRPSAGLPGQHEAVSMTIASTLGAEKEVMDTVAKMAVYANVEPTRVEDLRTAVSEACINAMRHGNQFDVDAQIRVEILVEAGTMVIDVLDQNLLGVDVDAIVVAAPDIEAQIAGRNTPGGMGLYLISKLVDSAEFVNDPEESGTRFSMTVDLGATQ